MQNMVSWFEIPSSDFARAVGFYKDILGVEIQEMDMFGTKMGMFPSDGENVSGAIVHGEEYKPSSDGVTVYLNGGENLQTILDKVEPNGGTVIVPKTQITEEFGCFAMFTDTEGNKVALHSMN
jgi:uncharacterized protein